MAEKKYWWERLKVVKEKPTRAKISPVLLKTYGKDFFPCRKPPTFRVPCYIKDGHSVAYVYEVKKSPAGWLYTYTDLGLCDPKWSTHIPEGLIEDKMPMKKAEALKILRKHYNAAKIFKK